jgi:hypothetical protein
MRPPPPRSSRTPHSTQPKYFPSSHPRLLSFCGLSVGVVGAVLYFFLPSPPRTLFLPPYLTTILPSSLCMCVYRHTCVHTHVLFPSWLDSIPAALGQLSNLRTLQLRMNQLAGSVFPPSVPCVAALDACSSSLILPDTFPSLASFLP